MFGSKKYYIDRIYIQYLLSRFNRINLPLGPLIRCRDRGCEQKVPSFISYEQKRVHISNTIPFKRFIVNMVKNGSFK